MNTEDMTEIEKLQSWTKQLTKEHNGLYGIGLSLRCDWISVQFMDIDRGVWIILCRDYSSEKQEHRVRMNIGVYETLERVKRLLEALGVEDIPA